MWEPINPAPPVTRARILSSLIQLVKIRLHKFSHGAKYTSVGIRSKFDLKNYIHKFRSNVRYWIASDKCNSLMSGEFSRSAMVCATFKILS